MILYGDLRRNTSKYFTTVGANKTTDWDGKPINDVNGIAISTQFPSQLLMQELFDIPQIGGLSSKGAP